MRTRRILRTVWVGLVFTAGFTPADAETRFVRLDLTDGRTLKDVAVKSYDPATGKVLLLAGRTAMSIPVSLIPAPFDEQVKAAVPVAGSNLTTVANRPAATATPPAPPRSHTSPHAVPFATGIPLRDDKAVRHVHRTAAVKRAERYFTYEFQAGSSALSVYDRDIEVEETEAIEGWAGRYRTKGRAFIQFYDSRGRSFSRSTSRFEVITEQKPGREVTIVDFTRLGEFR